MARAQDESWTEFTDGARIAGRVAVRGGQLALRPTRDWQQLLDPLDLPVRREGPFRQRTYLASLPLLPGALEALPPDVRTWVGEQRPEWLTWIDRERRLQQERDRHHTTLGLWSGLDRAPPQLGLLDRDPIALASGDHPAHDLYPYQRFGVRWLDRSAGRAVLGDDMGLGKTAQLLTYADLTPAVRRVLILAPATVLGVWRREGRRWAPSIPVIIGRSTKAVRRFVAAGDPPDEPRWALALSWGLAFRVVRELREIGFDTVIADEAHNIQTEDTLRTRATLDLAWIAERRLGGTGTEIRNRPRELWTLLHMVDPLRFPRFKDFGERYCGARWVTRADGVRIRIYKGSARLPELNRVIRPFIMRREKKAVLPQLPEKRRAIVPITATRALLRDHRGVLSDLGSANSAISTAALGAMSRMRKEAGLAKVADAVSWILNAVAQDEQVVVFLHHIEVHDALGERLTQAGVAWDSIIGATPQSRRDRNVDAFQAGDLQVIVGSMAMKDGVTLTAAAHTLHVERWLVPGDEEQAEDRVLRIGQTRGVVNTYLHLVGTIDEVIALILEAKRPVIAALRDRTPIEREIIEALRRDGLPRGDE